MKKQNRIFKFRVWDKSIKDWVKEDGKPITTINLEYWNDEKYIIQQFVGNLDRDGKEIFEGDICRDDFNGEKYYMFYYAGSFVLKTFKSDDSFPHFKQIFWPDKIVQYIKVVGNILENLNYGRQIV